MNNRLFVVIQSFLITLSVIAIELLFFNQYLMLFVFVNPLLLIIILNFIHPKQIYVDADDQDMIEQNKALFTTINHDINTPLTKIISNCEKSIMTHHVELNTVEQILEQAQFLKEINTTYFKFMSIMNLSSLSNITLDLTELLRESLINYIDILEGKNMLYDFDITEETILIRGDRTLLMDGINKLLNHVISLSELGDGFTLRLSSATMRSQLRITSNTKLNDQSAKRVFSNGKQTLQLSDTYTKNEIQLKLINVIIEKHNGKILFNHLSSGINEYTINFQNIMPE